MSKRLAGKVAFVTGGSRGIGAAIALAIAEEGADVVISYSSSAEKAAAVVEQIESKGMRGYALAADQGDLTNADRVLESVRAKFGRLDILVNNAGVYVLSRVDEDPDPVALRRQLLVNVEGVFAMIRAAAKILPENGRIITIGSAVATRTGFAGAADYSATKAAVAAFSRAAAIDLGVRGITVNTIQCGFIDTDMNPASSEWAAASISKIPLNRYGRPQEIAAGVTFLASPDASYITGTVLNIDGGVLA